MPCVKCRGWAKSTSIFVLNLIEQKRKKRICCIGRLPVKLSVHRRSGNGGLRKRIIQGIIHLFILNDKFIGGTFHKMEYEGLYNMLTVVQHTEDMVISID